MRRQLEEMKGNSLEQRRRRGKEQTDLADQAKVEGEATCPTSLSKKLAL